MSTTLPQTLSCSRQGSQVSPGTGKKSHRETLVLGTSLKIEHAVELRARILDTLERSDDLVLDGAAVLAADLSFIQIICAARRLAAGSEKRLSWTGPMPSVLIELLEAAGVTCSTLCDGHEDCLWP